MVLHILDSFILKTLHYKMWQMEKQLFSYSCDKLSESNIDICIDSSGESVGLFCNAKCFKESKELTEKNAIKQCLSCRENVAL